MNPSPTPTLPADFNLDTVTPGWVGFAITFLVVVVTVLLIMDMVRRIRRVRYRSEVRERLDEERVDEQRRTEDEADS